MWAAAVWASAAVAVTVAVWAVIVRASAAVAQPCGPAVAQQCNCCPMNTPQEGNETYLYSSSQASSPLNLLLEPVS